MQCNGFPLIDPSCSQRRETVCLYVWTECLLTHPAHVWALSPQWICIWNLWELIKSGWGPCSKNRKRLSSLSVYTQQGKTCMDITRGPSQALGHAAFYLGPPAPMTSFPVISLEWDLHLGIQRCRWVQCRSHQVRKALEQQRRPSGYKCWHTSLMPWVRSPLLVLQNKSLIQWCTSVTSELLLEMGDRNRLTQKLTDQLAWGAQHSSNTNNIDCLNKGGKSELLRVVLWTLRVCCGTCWQGDAYTS